MASGKQITHNINALTHDIRHLYGPLWVNMLLITLISSAKWSHWLYLNAGGRFCMAATTTPLKGIGLASDQPSLFTYSHVLELPFIAL